MKQRNKGFFSLGLPLLVTVLLTLLLVTFSLLTLNAARADRQRAELLGEHRRAYYDAGNRAEQVLARLISGEDPGTEVTAEGETLCYEIPIDEKQSLFVTLGQDFQILRWEAADRD